MDECPMCGAAQYEQSEGYCHACGYDAVEAYCLDRERNQRLAERWDDEGENDAE